MIFAPRMHLMRMKPYDSLSSDANDKIMDAIMSVVYGKSNQKEYKSAFMGNPKLYSPNYVNTVLSSYLHDWEKNQNDVIKFVPQKTVRKESRNFMGGVLGYTVLNEGWIVLRDDLHGDMKDYVDVHESIHTPDEYETRVITAWMLSGDKPRSMQY